MPEQIFSSKYVVQEEIARGGMGVILKALDRTLNRVVAIKQIHAHLSGDPSFSERFLREARAMARLQHDNIVTIYAVEEYEGTQFLVMEFFGPSNLRTLIRQPHRLPLRDVVRIGHQLSSALAYAHVQHIIHRDIKPANVLIDRRGKAKLTDFGIAAALDEASITSTGQVIGTPEYMSPEQARGVKLDGRSDLYSLGIMLYEMLTGKPPYADTSKTAILGKLVFEQQELALQFPPEVPSFLQGVVRDLLRRNPDERIPDADTLASQLHEILYTLPQASAPSADSEPTMTSARVDRPTEVPTRMASPPTERAIEAPTKTIFQSKTEFAPLPPTPAAKPAPPPLTQGLDETTILPAQPPQTPPKSKPPERPFTPPPPQPPVVRFAPLIGGGLVIVALLVGLISYLASRPITPSEEPLLPPPLQTTSPPFQGETTDTPTPAPALTAQAEELERQRKQLEEESNRLEEKKRLADMQKAKEEAEQREQERQRARAAQRVKVEEQTRKAAEEEKARLAAAQRAKEDELRRKTAEEEKARQAASQRDQAQRRADELAAIDRAKKEAQRAKDLEEKRGSSPPPPIEVPKVFPDPQLQSLLEKFKTAYERRDFDSLQFLSRMSDSRRANVEFMFSNYSTFTASIQNISRSEDGATALLVLQTGTRINGETIKIPPLSSRYKLQIPRRGEEWDKVLW